MSPEATGEYFIPGKFVKRLEDEHLERYRFAARFVNKRRILDIACGTGYGSYLLAQAGATYVDAVDVNPDVLQHAREKYLIDNLNFHSGDIIQFGEDATYDVAVCFETIEHVQDYVQALLNLYRILKPGGFLVISTPNRPMSYRPVATLHDQPRNPFHIREFDLDEFIDAVRGAAFLVPPSDILGQRQYVHIPNRYLRKFYALMFRPDDRSSPVVRPVSASRIMKPKYIVLVAHKPETDR